MNLKSISGCDFKVSEFLGYVQYEYFSGWRNGQLCLHKGMLIFFSLSLLLFITSHSLCWRNTVDFGFGRMLDIFLYYTFKRKNFHGNNSLQNLIVRFFSGKKCLKPWRFLFELYIIQTGVNFFPSEWISRSEYSNTVFHLR